MKSLKWMVPTAAVVGLLTAIFSFGDSALRFFALGYAEDEAEAASSTDTNLKISGTQHVVTHQSSTENVLTGSDDLVITAEMLNLPPGAATKYLEADNGERPSHLCSGYPLRIHNSTDQYVNIKIGVPNTDNAWTIGIGPGERYQTDLEGPDWYFVKDELERWYEIFPVDNCQTGQIWIPYKPFVDMDAL